MKRITLILIAVLALLQLCRAQAYNNQKLIYLDENDQPTREKKAFVLKQLIRLDDTLWEVNLYRINAPRMVSYQCSDPDGQLRNGQYLTYNSGGQLDTTGYYSKGVRAGIWTILTPGGRVAAQQSYRNGQLFWTMDSVQLKHHSDSLNILLKIDTTAFKKVEIESSFPGGGAGWLKYLEKNLRYPDKAVKNKIQGQVMIAFIVDTEGHISTNSVRLDHSVEFSLDQEALRIIFVSPDWTPAVQNGRKVKSYKKQPITFRFS